MLFYFSADSGSEFRFFKQRDGRPIYSVMNYQIDIENKNGEWIEIGKISRKNLLMFQRKICIKFAYLVKTCLSLKFFCEILVENSSNQWPNFSSMPEFSFNVSNFVCNLPCGSGEIRIYDESDRCCWQCETCQFPKFKFNETSCDSCPRLMQPNLARNSCEPVSIEFMDYSNFLMQICCAVAALGVILTLGVAVVFLFYSQTPIIKASGRELTHLLLVGIALTFGEVALIPLTPNVLSCAAVRFFYSLG